MERKNILWINILKAICIIGVFWVHSANYFGVSTPLGAYIHPYYVNAFFFISGYLLFRKQLSEPLIGQKAAEYRCGGGYKTLVLNILHRIMIPSVLFSVIEFLPSYMLRGKEFGMGEFLYKTIGGGTYWFTAALAVAELLIGLMLLTRRKSVWFYFVICSILTLIGWLMCRYDISIFASRPSLPWQYKNGLLCMVFMAFGGLYWRYEAAIGKLMNKFVLTGMIVVYVALLLWPKSFRVLISMEDLNLAGIGISLLATVILIELCKMIHRSKLLNYIGQNTIGFYFMSGALPIVLSMAVKHFLPESGFAGFAIVFAGSMVIAYFAVRLINRWLPWMLDLRVIGKK